MCERHCHVLRIQTFAQGHAFNSDGNNMLSFGSPLQFPCTLTVNQGLLGTMLCKYDGLRCDTLT